MKKSILAGLLGTLVLGGQTSYSTSSKTETNVNIQNIAFPKSTGISSSSSSQSVSYSTTEAIVNAKFATGDNSAQSIDSLFLTLPSLNELDRLILGADSVAILKTIQVVATDDSLSCDQRISYLLEVLGRIRAAVEKKQFAADQLKIIIDGALLQIKRLQKEIDILNGDIKNLWLDELHKSLSDAVANLENYYTKFNAIEANIAPNEAKVAGYEKEISILTGSSDAERNRIANDKLRLTEVEAIVRDYEARLYEARATESALEASIDKSKGIVSRNDARIAEIRATIANLEKEIQRYRDEIDRVRAKYNDLEIKVERLRTDLNVAQAKADKYRAEIRGLEDRIAVQRKKIQVDILDDLNDMISTLKKSIPNIQAEIDRHYYYCYGEGAVEVVQTGSVVVYIVKGERFGEYLRAQYGAGTAGSSLRQLGSIELRRVDIFSPVWSARFGYPFSKEALQNDGDLNLAGSFSCINSGNGAKGFGRIEEIGADYIGVKTDAGKARLRLGSCSRVESVSELPTIGQNIAYTAVQSGAQGYNLVQATCW